MDRETTSATWLERHRRPLMLGGTALILLVAAGAYLGGGRFVSTDDAYVQAARIDVSANIAGRVVEVAVKDNQAVKRGDLLFRLDDREYSIAVTNAKAKLAAARLKIAELKASYLQRRAEVQAARDTLAYLNNERTRQQRLTGEGIAPQAQLDQASHAARVAQQKLAASEQEQANIRASLGDDPGIPVTRHPFVQQAQAELERAELDLSYTEVRASLDGIVSKVDKLQPGAYIKAATPVFALTSQQEIWVEANFKETDLTHMRAGQAASVEIDSYPGHTFHGHLESLSSGTGSSFSLLPPENATGNWVKVVQRLPVRIRLDTPGAEVPLRAGLSAIVDVDTGRSRLKDYL